MSKLKSFVGDIVNEIVRIEENLPYQELMTPTQVEKKIYQSKIYKAYVQATNEAISKSIEEGKSQVLVGVEPGLVRGALLKQLKQLGFQANLSDNTYDHTLDRWVRNIAINLRV